MRNLFFQKDNEFIFGDGGLKTFYLHHKQKQQQRRIK